MKTYRFFFQPGFSRVQIYPVKKEKADKNSLLKGKSRQVYPVKKPDKPQARGRGQGVPLNLYSVGTGFAIAMPEKRTVQVKNVRKQLRCDG